MIKMIDDDTRMEIAKSLGWDVDKEMEKFLENDKCNCGHDISFIESEEDAEAFIIHMIQAFETGVNFGLQNQEESFSMGRIN